MLNSFTGRVVCLALAGLMSVAALPAHPSRASGSTSRSLTTEAAAPVGRTATVGGVLTGDEVWSPDAGVYQVTSMVQVPRGVTLTVEAGTAIESAVNQVFNVAGTLNILGSDSAPVRLSTPGPSGTFAGVLTDSRIVVRHLMATGVSNILPGDRPAHVEIADSRFAAERPNPFGSDNWLPPDVVMVRNEFINTHLFVLAGGGSEKGFVVENNRWGRNDPGGWNETALFAYSGTGSLAGNSFEAGDWTALATPGGGSGGAPYVWQVENNFWGSADPQSIGRRINDYRDSIGNPVLVDFEPFLPVPSAAATFTPLPPQTVVAKRGSRSAVVVWKGPLSDGGTAIRSYTVTSTPGGHSVTVPATTYSATVPNLTDGISYRFHVTAANTMGDSEQSIASGPVVPASPPEPPVDVTASAGGEVGSGRAVVRWIHRDSTVQRYQIRASPSGLVFDVDAVTDLNTPVSAPISGLQNGAAQTFVVVAINEVGSSAASAPSNAVVPAGAPGAINTPSVARADRSATVKWVEPGNNGSAITQYVVASSPGGLTRTVDGSATSVIITGLVNGTAYQFTVTAINAVGTGPQSRPSAAVVPAGRPGRVKTPTVRVAGQTITVGWGAVANNGSPVSRYVVTSDKGQKKVAPGSSRKAVFSGLKPGIYNFRVTAVNAVGSGLPSSTVRVRVR